MNKKSLIASIAFVTMLLTTACDTTDTSGHQSTSNSEPSSASVVSPSLGSESSSDSSNSSQVTPDNFTLEDAENALVYATLADEDFTEVVVNEYHFYEKYYQNRSTKMNSYADLTLYVGTTTNKDYAGITIASSNFREERTYENYTYTEIRKFSEAFAPTAYRMENMDELQALFRLNVGQGYSAYATLVGFKQNYSDGGVFQTDVLDDGSRHVSFIYTGETDENLYTFLAGYEFTIDEDFHVIDFWCSEGYYDSWYDNFNTAESMRRHGLVYGEGYSYSMSSYKLGSLTNYPLQTQFKIEDNFITEVSFSETEITRSISETKEDEAGYKSINLLELLISNPQIDINDLVNSCPINNLSFESSNPEVIQVNDGYYADFVGEGETIITVHDSAFDVAGSNTLKIILSA